MFKLIDVLKSEKSKNVLVKLCKFINLHLTVGIH